VYKALRVHKVYKEFRAQLVLWEHRAFRVFRVYKVY
jgi:hypothetical protein